MSNNGRKQLVLVEREDLGSHLAAFLAGALVGAGIALLLAPQSGAETQRSIKEGAKKLRDVAGSTVRGAQRQLGETLEAARDGALDRLDSVRDAVDAGRKVAGETRRDLEKRLNTSKEAYRAGMEAARAELARSAPAQRAGDEGPGEGADAAKPE